MTPNALSTSDNGLAQLEAEEGLVLRAYRDPTGTWTIGPGLTAASGVVVPKAGMTITLEEARRLTRLALASRYEPAVRAAMPQARQHEFDAGILFHWNTGAISRASWVSDWSSGKLRSRIRLSLSLWNKSAGKVLPGLTARRRREADLLLDGVYWSPEQQVAPVVAARLAVALTQDELARVRQGLISLGYNVGADPRYLGIGGICGFQADHGLSVDGVVGRATLSTLQRALDARSKAIPAIAATTTAIAGAVAGLTAQISDIPHADAVPLTVAGLWLARQAWRYCDIAAARIGGAFPRLATLLRSL